MFLMRLIRGHGKKKEFKLFLEVDQDWKNVSLKNHDMRIEKTKLNYLAADSIKDFCDLKKEGGRGFSRR